MARVSGCLQNMTSLRLARTRAHVGEGVDAAPAEMMPRELHDSEAVFEGSVMWHAISPASRYPPGKACGPPLSLATRQYDVSVSSGHAAAPEPS